MKNSPNSRIYLALGLLATLVALVSLFSLMRLKSLADTAQQTANTGNSEPSVTTVNVQDGTTLSDVTQDGFTPNEGATRDLVVSGSVHDQNGCSDITGVSVAVFRTEDPTDYDAGLGEPVLFGENANSYYRTFTATTTGCSGAGDMDEDYSATFHLKNYVDATDSGAHAGDYWKVLVIVEDHKNAQTGDSFGLGQSHFEVNSVAAVNLSPTTINYSTVALGANSDQKSLRLYNSGNRIVDSLIKADGDMHSSLTGYSDIPASNTHVAWADYMTYDEALAVSTTDRRIDTCVPQGNSGGEIPSNPVFLTIKMPSENVNGVYTNTLTLTAVATATCPGELVLDCNTHPDDPACP